MKLVINADDFGYTKANTDGIIEGYKKGIVRSTTAMCNMPYLEYGKKLAEDCPELGIGVHLTLTMGYSLTPNKTLTDENGHFLKQAEIKSKELDMDEVYTEWKAQIERYIDVFGHLPTHLDSHHGAHDFNEKQLSVASRLAKEYGLEMRRHGPFKFDNGFYEDTATVETMITLIKKYLETNEDVEMMAHPGYCDLDLYRHSSYNVQRVKELDVLCDPRLMAFIEEHHIELAHY